MGTRRGHARCRPAGSPAGQGAGLEATVDDSARVGDGQSIAGGVGVCRAGGGDGDRVAARRGVHRGGKGQRRRASGTDGSRVEVGRSSGGQATGRQAEGFGVAADGRRGHSRHGRAAGGDAAGGRVVGQREVDSVDDRGVDLRGGAAVVGAPPRERDLVAGQSGQAERVTGPDRAGAVGGGDLRGRADQSAGRRKGLQVGGPALGRGVGLPRHVGGARGPADDLDDVRGGVAVGGHAHRSGPGGSGIGRVADVPDVRGGAHGVPGDVQGAASIDGDGAVDPPGVDFDRAQLGMDLLRARRPRDPAVGRAGEVLIAGGQREGVGVGLVSQIHRVDVACRVDQQRGHVSAHQRIARPDWGHRPERLPAIGGLLDHLVELSVGIGARPTGTADILHVRRARVVIPRHVDRAVRGDRDEVTVAEVAGRARSQRGGLGEGGSLVEGGLDHRVVVAAGVEHEGHVHDAGRADRERRVPSAAGARHLDRRAVGRPAVSGPGVTDPAAADPRLIHVRRRGGLHHLSVLPRTGSADIDRPLRRQPWRTFADRGGSPGNQRAQTQRETYRHQ